MASATLYEILGVGQDASTEEIRAAYRAAALRLHPDKRAAAGACSNSGGSYRAGSSQGQPAAASATAMPAVAAGVGGNNSGSATGDDAPFVVVQRAWEVLQDPSLRADYDRSLALDASRQEVHVNEEVALSEMAAGGEVYVEGELCYCWPCRCGGQFLLPLSDCPGGVVGAGEAEDWMQQEAATEMLVPCCTCSLHIQVAISR